VGGARFGGSRPGGDVTGTYYASLQSHPDPARIVGWESRLAQLTRFAIAAHFVRPGDRVLDLGAGLGDLSRYLAINSPQAKVIGFEVHPPFLRRARELDPPVHLVNRDAFDVDSAEATLRGQVVAALGALVDGSDLSADSRRFTRLRRLFAGLVARTERVAIAVMAKQEAIEGDPLRREDPALGGLRTDELPWLIPEGWRYDVRDDVLPTDRVVLLSRDPEPLTDVPPGAEIRAAALAHPLAARATAADRVRFHLLLEEVGRARALIEAEEARPGFHPDDAWRLLRQRLALMTHSGVW